MELSVGIYIVSLHFVCSSGSVVLIESRITQKSVEAVRRIAMALATQVRHQRGMFRLSTPQMGVGERQRPSNLKDLS